MKYLICTIMAACSLTGAYAQKGSVLLYGGLSAGTATTTDNGLSASNTTWTVNPGIGYQFSDHITVGISGEASSYGSGIANWSAGAFGRYTQYLGPIFFVYLQAEADRKSYTNGEEQYTANLFPSAGAFIYKGWAATLSLLGIQYSYDKSADNHRTTSNIGINLGKGYVIGVSKNFIRHMRQAPKEQPAQ